MIAKDNPTFIRNGPNVLNKIVKDNSTLIQSRPNKSNFVFLFWLVNVLNVLKARSAKDSCTFNWE